jgi:hypothetical protein
MQFRGDKKALLLTLNHLETEIKSIIFKDDFFAKTSG